MVDYDILKERLDSGGMYDAIVSFPDQIEECIGILNGWSPKHKYADIQNILILGMGGSAIGGDVIKVMVQDECKIPIIINRNYNIPGWVGSKTLVFASSYSGNTEETLSAFDKCMKADARIIVISTGGEVTQLAEKYNLDLIKIPSGFQPRAALGYSFSACLLSLNILKFVSNEIIENLKNSVSVLREYAKTLQQFDEGNSAIHIAERLQNTFPVIYGSEDLTWVAALRFRGQLAENAKMMALHHHLPEQNHNEIEGWNCYPQLLDQMCILWLPDEDDHVRSRGRMEVTADLLSDKSKQQITLYETGDNRIERLLKLIHYCDWVSYYLALLNNVDPTPVDRIQMLKLKMSKL